MRVTGAGRLVVPADVSLRQVLAVSVPAGWLPAALPDDVRITTAAAIGADVHGLNHAGAGSFGHHVRWLDLRIADGRVLRLSRVDDPAAFWATIGGTGRTGRIIRAELQLQRLTTHRLRRTRVRTGTLAQTLAVFGEAAAGQWHNPNLHVVARLDPRAPEDRLGRSLIETFRPEPVLAGRAMARVEPFAPAAPYRSGRRRWPTGTPPVTDLVHVSALYPGPDRRPARYGGLVRYECTVPENRAWLLADVLRLLRRSDVRPARAAITRFGVANGGVLSFPRPGWSLALGLPARRPGLIPALATVDQLLARYGGRVLLSALNGLGGLSSLSGTDSAVLASMYPRHQAWRAVRDRLDPQWEFPESPPERVPTAPRS